MATGLVIATPLSASSSPAISQVVIASGFAIPFGLAIDQTGHLYVSDVGDSNIFQVTSSGVKTSVASLPGGSYPVAVDSSGDLFYANTFTGTVYKLTPGGTQSTYLTGLLGVYGLATDSLGDLFVSSYNDSTVTEIAPNGTQTSIGSFSGAWGLAVDAQNNLYVADYNDGTVWKVTPGGVRTVVVNGLETGTPMYVAVDASGNVYVAESFNGDILEVAPNGSVSTFASGIPYPASIAFDPHGNLYAIFAVTNELVEFLTTVNPPTDLVVSAAMGTESATWSGDGTATSYTCTLMYGFTDPTTFTDTTTSTTCKFNGLSTVNYGIQVVANNGTTASTPVVGFAMTPSTTTTTTTTVPRAPIRTITCVRKKSVRRVRGVNPHCPAGYHLK
jgi:sugar lactone lactonase YvrE